MLTLALDTATGVCTVGLVQDGHVLAEYDISVGLTHSEGLMLAGPDVCPYRDKKRRN